MCSLYSLLPVWTQHLAVSMRGYYLRRIRYTDKTWSLLEELSANEFRSFGEIQEQQLCELRKLVDFAAEFSPFYRTLYNSAGISGCMIRNLSDLKILSLVQLDSYCRTKCLSGATAMDKIRIWIKLLDILDLLAQRTLCSTRPSHADCSYG